MPTGDVGVTACEDSGLFGLQDVCGGRLFIAVVWQSTYSHFQLQGVCLAGGMFVLCPVRLCVCVGRSANSLELHRSLIGMAGDCAAFDVRWEGVDVLRHNACYRRVRCCLGGGTIALLSHLPSH